MSNVPQPPDESNPNGSPGEEEAISPAVLEVIRETLREELSRLQRQRNAGIEPLLSVEEAADMLGLSVRSVNDLIAMGELPVADVGPKGGKRKIAPEALEDYVQRCAR